MKNVFLVGWEPFNSALLKSFPNSDQLVFHYLLSYGKAVRAASRRSDFAGLLSCAKQRLSAFSGTIGAIVGYWDFPNSVIVPVLARNHRLPGPTLESVAKCEHRYWSRLEQQNVVPDLVARFCVVDPFVEPPLSQIDIAYPVWLKRQ